MGDTTDNVNTALADTNMLFNFEPPTTSTPTKHRATTTRELHTPAKLITFNVVDMATSPFAHHKILCALPNNNNTQEPQIRDEVAYLLKLPAQCSDDKNTLTLKTRHKNLIFAK